LEHFSYRRIISIAAAGVERSLMLAMMMMMIALAGADQYCTWDLEAWLWWSV